MNSHHSLVAEGLEAPFADGSDGFDGSETVVCDEDLADSVIAASLANEVLDAVEEPACHGWGRGMKHATHAL